MGAVVVMGIYPFFVEISAGGLKQRTHLPVRPYITHRGKPTHVNKTTVVIPLYLFFVDTSAGGLTHRTHLSVRPYILHRGKHPRRGYGGNRYSDASVPCGHIRRRVEPSDVPAGTSPHHASRKTHRRGDWGGCDSDASVLC